MPPSLRPETGILLLIVAVGCTTVVDTAAKYLSGNYGALQLTWGYFLGILLHVGGYLLLRRRGVAAVRTRRLPLQLARAGLLVGSIACLFVGYRYLPMTDAVAISFMSPLFIVALSGPLLGERVGAGRWVAVLVGFAGVLVIIRPGGGIAHWAVAMPLLSAFCFAGYQLATRALAASDPIAATLFWTALGGFGFASLLAPWQWSTPTVLHWLAFLALGTLGATAHLCLIGAFRAAPASLLAPFNYSKLIWAAALGFAVFGDLPSANTLAGSALIAAAGCYAVLAERRSAPRG